jgi:hypothetical protein
MKKLIGISGFARSGKDTFYERAAKILAKDEKKSHRIAFADALKNELNELLIKNVDISAFTENNEEKELIRPLLVTYGTEIRRKLNQNCWIERVQPRVIHHLNEGDYVFVTDVRFENEAKWITMNGGCLVNIHREGIEPANHEEHRQSIRMRKYISYNIHWPTFGEDDIEQCDDHILPIIAHIVQTEPKFQEIL